MSLFTGVRAILRGGTVDLKPLEIAVLHALTEALPRDSATRLERRLKEVNLVQRHDGGREVNCYQFRKGKPIFSEESRVVSASGEMTLARFSLLAGDGTPIAGRVLLVDGHFFSLEFDQPTEHFLDDSPADIKIILEIDA